MTYYSYFVDFLVDVDKDCNSDPCLNGAVCFDIFGEFFCVCAQGYSGATCEIGKFMNNLCFIPFMSLKSYK